MLKNNKFSEELFLTNETGKYLYHTYAENLPIIDYHCHLIPQEIYENKRFADLGEMWLAHDHYKWRAMRAFGIEERYITGNDGYYEKFIKFAEILPAMIGNPIYIWCALELKRYFDIDDPLDGKNADYIYELTKQMISVNEITPQWCMKRSQVELVSTTDDPIDSLQYHRMLKEEAKCRTRVIPAFRPDKAFYCEKAGFSEYVKRLGEVSGVEVHSFQALMAALEIRLDFFYKVGTNISDNGIEDFQWCDYCAQDIEDIFGKALNGEPLSAKEIYQYRSAFLEKLGQLYHSRQFVMQLHIGTYQGANKSGEADIGVACGFDCIDDSTPVKSIGELLHRLSQNKTLPKTILYPLNPTQIETFAVLAAGFCEGGTAAKVQLGAPWWFNDQAYGLNRQFEALSNLYPLSLSAGMLTDSRSFISYPRHEVYRRVLCNYLGKLVERGEYFSGEEAISNIIKAVCYKNAKECFFSTE